MSMIFRTKAGQTWTFGGSWAPAPWWASARPATPPLRPPSSPTCSSRRPGVGCSPSSTLPFPSAGSVSISSKVLKGKARSRSNIMMSVVRIRFSVRQNSLGTDFFS